MENWLSEVWENEGGFPWDVPILLAIHSTANPQLDFLAVMLTKLGVFWGVFPVATIIALALFVRRRWRSLTYLITTLLGSIIINRTAKVLLHRVRPHLWESPAPEFDYGFPSGHAIVLYDVSGGSETEAVTRGKVTKESAESSFGVGTSSCLTQKLRSRTRLQFKLFGKKFRLSFKSELLAGSVRSLVRSS